LTRAIIDSLEARMFMHAGEVHDPIILNLDSLPAMESTTTTGTGPDLGITTNGPIAVSQLQKHHSRPGTTAKLYLDFNGSNAMTWGSFNVPAQSAWSSDADATTFSDLEQQAIYEVWARVAEKYAPFNIDVTTEDPGNRTAYETLAVVFASDTGTWLGGEAGGVAYINSFRGGTGGNTVWVFPKNLGPYHPKYAAEAAAHESGHGFGLNHQATWSGATKTNEYNPGNSLAAPIMGNSYSSQRGLWWNGTSAAGSTVIQDDLAILTSSTNRFGYAADDHSNTVDSGTALVLNGTAVSGHGVIERMTDSDVFSFDTGAGAVQLTVDPAAYGAMLNLKLSLYGSDGTLVAAANAATFTETLNVTVNAGTYKLVVASNGAYGDIGQYRVRGTVVAPAAPTLTAPTNLAATASGGQVALTWTDTNSTETGYVVQRSANGSAFADYATVSADSAAYVDTGVSAGSSYSYRVLATDETTRSAASNTAAVTLAPTTPVSLAASAVSDTQINLAWSDVSGETGYRIERSTDGVNFATLTTVGAGVVTYANTGLAAATTYLYRIVAINAGGESAASPVASATTQAAPVVVSTLDAPTNVKAVTQKNGRVRITWTDTNSNETGYRIEVSTNGTTFSLLANVAANTTSYQTGRLSGTFYFRLKAYNATTESAYSSVASTAAGARGSTVLLATSAGVQTSTASRVFNFLTKLPARR
jgi:hypothetical protein